MEGDNGNLSSFKVTDIPTKLALIKQIIFTFTYYDIIKMKDLRMLMTLLIFPILFLTFSVNMMDGPYSYVLYKSLVMTP